MQPTALRSHDAVIRVYDAAGNVIDTHLRWQSNRLSALVAMAIEETCANDVGPEITIDYVKSILTVDGKSFPFPPLSPAAQELIVAGGAEKLVASRLNK